MYKPQRPTLGPNETYAPTISMVRDAEGWYCRGGSALTIDPLNPTAPVSQRPTRAPTTAAGVPTATTPPPTVAARYAYSITQPYKTCISPPRSAEPFSSGVFTYNLAECINFCGGRGQRL